MFNSTALEVGIGMALVYLLLSLFCTAINEGIAAILKTRAKNLEKGIRSLFTEGDLIKNGTSLVDAIYRHGLVQSLYRSGEGTTTTSDKIKNPPSYIPSRVFASALYDVLFPNAGDPPAAGAQPAAAPDVLRGMLAALNSVPDSPAKTAILALVKEAKGEAEKTRAAFERWYDDGMDRVAGWYKKSTQWWLFGIGLLAAIALNVNTLAVAHTLWSNPAAREVAVGYADNIVKDDTTKKLIQGQVNAEKQNADKNADQQALASAATDTSGITQKLKARLEPLQSLNLPIGWTEDVLLKPFDPKSKLITWPQRFDWKLAGIASIGWLLTAIAMTLGAPFWFDTLNQFMVVRSTIKPREKSDTEGSKDAQKKP